MGILNTMALLASILPIKSLAQLVEQAIPRPVYAIILTAAIHAVAVMEQINARIAVYGEQGTPLGSCLLAMQTTLQTAVETDTGSSVVKAIPDLVAQAQTFIATMTPSTITTASGKAVAIHAATAPVAQQLAEAQSAAMAQYLPEVASDPISDATTGNDFTGGGAPGMPIAGDS